MPDLRERLATDRNRCVAVVRKQTSNDRYGSITALDEVASKQPHSDLI